MFSSQGATQKSWKLLHHLVKTIQQIACGLKGNQVEVRAFRHEDGEFS